jgi:hypothetical protein
MHAEAVGIDDHDARVGRDAQQGAGERSGTPPGLGASRFPS